MKRFIIIGISDAPQPTFSTEVHDIIRRAHVFSGGKRHHELVAQFLPEDAVWIDITAPVEAVIEKYKALFTPEEKVGNDSSAADVASSLIIFASGDPLFFGFANTLRRLMPDAAIQLYPTFNSLQLLAHRLVLPYHDMRIVSLTGRPWPELDSALIRRSPKIGILTDREHTPDAIARRLLDYGYTHYVMHVGEHLGNPQHERVTTLSLAEAAEAKFGMPNCVILAPPPASSAEGGASSPQTTPFGLADADFALLDGREKMITKMPIRLLTLQALDLPHRHTLWDIGACTGSVSIEARLLFPHLRIEAFEIRRECEAILRENTHRFGAPGIGIHIGDFLEMDDEALQNLSQSPSPASCDNPLSSMVDAIFIGGHGGRLREMMAKAVRYLTPGGVVVMNSVTSPVVERITDHRPSSQQLFDEACAQLGLRQCPPLRIQLDDYNPITILKAEKA